MTDEKVKFMFATLINTIIVIGEQAGAGELLRKDLHTAGEQVGITIDDLMGALDAAEKTDP